MRVFSRVPNIDFMSQRKHALVLSAVLTLTALLILATRGLHLGIDFTGGVLVEVTYPQSVELDRVRAELKNGGYPDAVLQYFGGTSDVLIRLAPDPSSSSAAISSRVLQALDAQSKGIQLRRIEFVGPQVGEELTVNGVLALLCAFIGIMIYIMFRFEWKFSVGAIMALLHDAIMTLGFLSLIQEEFDLTVLAAILAMIGYSNNETIVLFDRVRENLLAMRKAQILDVINRSINQTLMRSVITHFTVLLVLSALLILGGKSVHGFAVAMMVGVCVATYSSIYISSGVVVLLGISREDLLPPKSEEIDEMP